MKKHLFMLFFSCLSLFCSCKSLLNQYASWNFLQEAKFELGLLYEENNRYFLPFTCDLTIANSAPLYIVKSKIKIINNEINFHLIYGLNKQDEISSLNLGKIKTGVYKIYYLDKNHTKIYINEINVP